jgi:tetratricopeptide (TPR) repeat protein
VASQRWDFFLAHASADSPTAQRLRLILEPDATVFEDSMIPAGVEWDTTLARHLQASSIIVVLISPDTPRAYYQREEIAAALSLALENPDLHRVVPLYLRPLDRTTIPYGLAIRSSIELSGGLDLDTAACRLLESLRDLRSMRREGPHESAAIAVRVLRTLDVTARGSSAMTDGEPLSRVLMTALDDAVGVVARRTDDPDAVASRLQDRLRTHGLAPDVVLPQLVDQSTAVSQWSVGYPEPNELAAFLIELREALVRHLPEAMRGPIREALATYDQRTHDPATVSRFELTLAGELGLIRSTSSEASRASKVLPAHATGAANTPHRLKLSSTAQQMCQLPARDLRVTGRSECVQALAERICTAVKSSSTGAIAWLTGQPGVGASTVAVEIAHVLTSQFSGGTRYIDLRGLDPVAKRSPETAIRLLCASLGHAADSDAMVTEDDLGVAYQVALQGRGVLVVLDNARDAAHVERLTQPPRSCAVVVTSRDRIQSVADPHLVEHIGPLSREAAIQLLTTFQSPQHTKDTAALNQIAELCADLPLALRLVGSRIACRPELPLEHFAELLSSELTRLDYMAIGDRAVRAAIQLSYDSFDDSIRRVFRFLPALPGSVATCAEMAHALAEEAAQVELWLHRLVDHSVASYEAHRTTSGRSASTFRLFDLVRLFALEVLGQESPETVKRFQRRGVAFLRDRLAEVTDEQADADLSLLLDPARFEAALDIAENAGWLQVSLELARDLYTLHQLRSDVPAWMRIGLRLAELYCRSNKPGDAVDLYLELASNINDDGKSQRRWVAKAFELAQAHQLGDHVVRAGFELSLLQADDKRWEAALQVGEEAANALVTMKRTATAVPIFINNCKIALEMADFERALHWGKLAVDTVGPRDETRIRASALFEYGKALARAAAFAQAIDCWKQAASLYLQADNPVNAAMASLSAAYAEVAAYSYASATELLRQAAHYFLRGQKPELAIEALVDLAALYAEIDDLTHARETLDHAIDVVQAEPTAHAQHGFEVAIRHLAVRFLINGERPASKATMPLLPLDEGGGQEPGEIIRHAWKLLDHLRIDRPRKLFNRHRGSRDVDQARNELRAFLGIPMINRQKPFEFWAMRELGNEPQTAIPIDRADNRSALP